MVVDQHRRVPPRFSWIAKRAKVFFLLCVNTNEGDPIGIRSASEARNRLELQVPFRMVRS